MLCWRGIGPADRGRRRCVRATTGRRRRRGVGAWGRQGRRCVRSGRRAVRATTGRRRWGVGPNRRGWRSIGSRNGRRRVGARRWRTVGPTAGRRCIGPNRRGWRSIGPGQWRRRVGARRWRTVSPTRGRRSIGPHGRRRRVGASWRRVSSPRTRAWSYGKNSRIQAEAGCGCYCEFRHGFHTAIIALLSQLFWPGDRQYRSTQPVDTYGCELTRR